MPSFEEYYASTIAPQKTLLKQFNEVIKYLKENKIDTRRDLYIYNVLSLTLTTVENDDIDFGNFFLVSEEKIDIESPTDLAKVCNNVGVHTVGQYQSDEASLIFLLRKNISGKLEVVYHGSQTQIEEINALEIIRINLKDLEIEWFEL